VGDLFARAVFFVRDAQRSLDYYTKTLGFSLDWTHEVQGRPFVFQVSLFGFQLILNQAEPWTEHRPGCGRVFIGLDDDQSQAFRDHIRRWGIEVKPIQWGGPTLVIHDVDENELFIWPPREERAHGE
jgi:catechol 2,3-dioxygenase-like lactoylglutathione lyase family enzyme